MNFRELEKLQTRRHFFGRAATGIGTAALASLLNPQLFAAEQAGAVDVESREPAIGILGRWFDGKCGLRGELGLRAHKLLRRASVQG